MRTKILRRIAFSCLLVALLIQEEWLSSFALFMLVAGMYLDGDL